MNHANFEEPRPPAAEIRRLMEAELTSSARTRFTLLLLFDLAVLTVITSLLMTEPDLPLRTQIAFAAMIVVALSWAVFFLLTLRKRRIFLAEHRLHAARLATIFTAVFAAGMVVLAVTDPRMQAVGFSAAGIGALMFAGAATLLIRARREMRALLDRRRGLERNRMAVLLLAVMLFSGESYAQLLTPTPFDVNIPAPLTLVTALGRGHLVYEVHVTNFSPDEHRLLALSALDDADRRVLGSWQGPELAQRLAHAGHPPADSAVVRAGERVVVYVWLTLPPGAPAPRAIHHRLTTARVGVGDRHELLLPAVGIGSKPVSLDTPPVGSGRWVSVRGPSNTSGHRRSLVPLDGAVRVPQRFAVDWVRLGDDGTMFRGDGSKVEDWYGYDMPVRSVSAGRVIRILDGVPDGTPRVVAGGENLDADRAVGNAVVVDGGEGRFAVYAHLRAGSIEVKEGDQVRSGQRLGRIGNSGHSLAPHLHFHLSDGPRPLGSEGLPFVLKEFRLLGRLDGMPAALAGAAWVAEAARPARSVTGEMPLENMVIEVTQ